MSFSRMPPKNRKLMLAEEIGIIQSLVSNYESGRLRLHAEMLARLALALEVSADELLGLKKSKEEKAPKRKFLRRLKLTEQLSKREQEALLMTIDAFLAKNGLS